MDKSTQLQPADSPDFTIVGIGASAGGLSALKSFFSGFPKDSGLAFVIVVHLNPDKDSHLAELLAKHVAMPVQQVTKTVPIEPNHIYVIPPNANLDTIDTHLRLSELEERRRMRAPIDHFLRTLAATHYRHAIGIILTGVGSDGTLGVREIKGRGGMVIVQDPTEAEFDGMPQSAIATGLADQVLPLKEMAKAIIRFARTNPEVDIPEDEEALKESSPEEDHQKLLHKIFTQIQSHTGRDFDRYKPSTILRRITRRMQIHQIEQLADYLKLLRKEPDEIRTLADDLLITVTSFFRDTEVYNYLEQQAIPQLFADKTSNESIRVWSVGCATGEEAYSLAMLFVEQAPEPTLMPSVQIFATDLHEPSLNQAREGFYPGDITTDVSPERIKRFFIKEAGGYRIRKEIREMVVFAPHNLLGDPPFSHLNLVVCRNLLIYLQRNIQRDVIELFHYALLPDGYLLLGSSETIEHADLFLPENKKLCLYRKRNVPRPELHLPVFPPIKSWASQKAQVLKSDGETIAYGELHQQMVERYAPPSLLVSPDDKVVHLSENMGRYLIHPGGEITTSVFNLVREELRIELRAILYTARKQKVTVRSKPILIEFAGKVSEVVLHLRVSDQPQQEGFFLVIFDERGISDEQQKQTGQQTATDNPRMEELEDELSFTKQRLQVIIEEYETSREEMKASSEEMQSNNEELRSTLEELETSKEELQSMNEELSTVNLENRFKVKELAQLTGDLQNLLTATDIATLFLDRDLRIMRFTPQVSELFNIRGVDRGRPLTELNSQLTENSILENAQQVLDKLTPYTTEIKDNQERWYLTRILPYRSAEDRIEGVVITFVNINELKQVENDLKHSEAQFRALIEASAQMVWTTNATGKVVEDSPSWRDYTGQTYQELKQGGLLKAVHPEDRKAAEATWKQSLETGSNLLSEYRIYHAPTQEYCWTTVRAVPLRKTDDSIRGWVGMNIDITQQKKLERTLRQAKEDAEQAAAAKGDFLALMSHEIRTPLSAILGITNLLLDKNVQPEQVENLQTLKFSADNLRTLINDILDFSKIEAGKVAIEETNLNLPTLLHSLEKAYEPTVQEKGNELKFNLDERIPETVQADSLKLSQVLNNLISNATKFTQNGTITVDVSLERKKQGGYLTTFSVEDTGIGIPANKLDTIFETFTQADISTVRQYGGTGLGLSITKLLLEIMGSQIEVESEEGKGTCFFFTLLLKEGLADTITAEEPVTPTNETTLLSSARVLLVEDAPINRSLLIQFLQQWWNFSPDTANNGKEAVEMTQQFQYDLILMDIRMPVMDGYQAARAIRKLPNYAQIPILALTADTADEVKARPEAALFQQVITKPFEPQDLRQKVLLYIQSSDSVPAPLPSEEPAPLALDLQKVENIFNDKRSIQQFLENALGELTKLQSQYTQAMVDRDATTLNGMLHNTRALLEILNLTSLHSQLIQNYNLVKESAEKEVLQELQSQTEAHLWKACELLQQHLDGWKAAVGGMDKRLKTNKGYCKQ